MDMKSSHLKHFFSNSILYLKR